MGLLRAISGRIRSFRDVKNAVDHHGERVARKLDAQFNPLLPESLKIDFWKLIQAILEILKHSCDKLVGAEHLLVGERGNDSGKQGKRDFCTQTLYQAMLKFRNAVRGVYDPPNIEEYGFPTSLSRVPFELLRQGEFLLDTLGQNGFAFPEPVFTDGVDLPKELAKLQPLVDELRTALGDAEGELKLAQVAKVDKDLAEKDWDVLFGWGARMITALFIWAGEKELADYMQPSTRRPGRTRRIARQERNAGHDGGEHDGGDQEPDDTGDTSPDDTGDTSPDDTSPDDTGDTSPDETTPGSDSPDPDASTG